MALGEMEILGRGLQIFMSQEQLNGAQVGAGFEKMCGKAMAQGIVVLLIISIQ